MDHPNFAVSDFDPFQYVFSSKLGIEDELGSDGVASLDCNKSFSSFGQPLGFLNGKMQVFGVPDMDLKMTSMNYHEFVFRALQP